MKFLISFELLLIVAAPSILAMFVINVWRYSRRKEKLDLALIGASLWLGLTIGAWDFLYYPSGWTPRSCGRAAPGSPRTTSFISA